VDLQSEAQRQALCLRQQAPKLTYIVDDSREEGFCTYLREVLENASDSET
jgi:hypothetical protein